MKILKYILFSVIGIVAFFLIAALFLPADYTIERQTTINRPVQEVYPAVIDYREWQNWNPWNELDPDAEHSFSGEPGTMGSKWSWKGKYLGTGELTLIGFETDKNIKSKLRFIEPQQMETDDIWTFEGNNGSTDVSWKMEGTLGYPLERVFGLFIDGMMGPDMEKGLARLKTYTENKSGKTTPDEEPTDAQAQTSKAVNANK